MLVVLFLAVSCQKETEPVVEETATETELTVAYIAENYDNPDLSLEEMNKIADAYLQLDAAQMNSYFQIRGELMKERGMDPAAVDTRVEMLLEINKNLEEETGKSYAQADLSKFENTFKMVSAKKQYKISEASMEKNIPNCERGSWSDSGSFSFRRYVRSSADNYTGYSPVSFAGFFNFRGNSTDCDLVYYSNSYSSSRRARYIVASTARAINAMRGFVRGLREADSTTVPGKQVYTSSSRTRLRAEFLVGFGRVWGNYPFYGAASAFAREVWVAST